MYAGEAAVGMAQVPTARQENPVTSARGKADVATKKVHDLRSMVVVIADRVFGPPPPRPERADRAVGRSGEAGLLHDQMDDLHEALDALRDELERLVPLGYADPDQPKLVVANNRRG